MSEEEAARYVGVSRNTFRERVGGLWPEPIKFGRRKLYDRAALDRAVDGITFHQNVDAPREFEL